jgi:predicted Zn finger-like uncharacterized protein
MIITCPNCSSRFKVNPDTFPPEGRDVRCGKCKHKWFAVSEPEEVFPEPGTDAPEETLTAPEEQKPFPQAPLPPSNPLVDEPIESAHSRRTRLKKKAILKSIGAIFGAILIVFALLFALKVPLTKGIPQTAAFYKTFGFNVSEKNKVVQSDVFQIGAVERVVSKDGELTVLTFKGKVTNRKDMALTVPKLSVTLFNASGVAIDEWVAQVEKSPLGAGETSTWVCRFFNPNLENIDAYTVQFRP